MLINIYKRGGVKKILYLIYHYRRGPKCPFCGYASNIMYPFGEDAEAITRYKIIGAGRRNVRCINCGSTDRERLVYIYLKFVACVFKCKDNPIILHIAPEPRLRDKLREGPFEYIAGDLFTEGYEYPDYVRNMDLCNLPLADNSVDILICNHVLEHIENDRMAMKEIYRVLKATGFAILQVPISPILKYTIEDFTVQGPEQRLKIFGQRDHCRIYGADYIERLEYCGLKVTVVNLDPSFHHKYNINPKESLYLVRKL